MRGAWLVYFRGGGGGEGVKGCFCPPPTLNLDLGFDLFSYVQKLSLIINNNINTRA